MGGVTSKATNAAAQRSGPFPQEEETLLLDNVNFWLGGGEGVLFN